MGPIVPQEDAKPHVICAVEQRRTGGQRSRCEEGSKAGGRITGHLDRHPILTIEEETT